MKRQHIFHKIWDRRPEGVQEIIIRKVVDLKYSHVVVDLQLNLTEGET